MYKHHSHMPLNGLELFIVLWPFIFAALAVGALILPTFEFTAICQNVPGGDICTISLD